LATIEKQLRCQTSIIEQRALPKSLARDVKVDIEGASAVAYVKLVLHRRLENAI